MSVQTIKGEAMPLVRIDVHSGRSRDELGRLSRGIHDAILAEYGIPERDYFHIVTEHAPGQIVAQDAGLGFERTRDVIMIQIFTQGGRSQEAKQSLFAAVADKLGALGVAGEDVFIGYVENTAGGLVLRVRPRPVRDRRARRPEEIGAEILAPGPRRQLRATAFGMQFCLL
jgi:phenylpyruvate tautomerase PptA (4-oxalocrotonate tautomerase family)